MSPRSPARGPPCAGRCGLLPAEAGRAGHFGKDVMGLCPLSGSLGADAGADCVAREPGEEPPEEEAAVPAAGGSAPRLAGLAGAGDAAETSLSFGGGPAAVDLALQLTDSSPQTLQAPHPDPRSQPAERQGSFPC